MEALIPLAAVIACAVATLLVLESTLRSHEEEADEAAQLLAERRRETLSASGEYLRAFDACEEGFDPCANELAAEASRSKRLLDDALQEKDLEKAARIDDELLEALMRLHRSRSAVPASVERAYRNLLRSHAESSQTRELYNNRAVTCNNEACAFPLLLVAKRIGYRRKPPYRTRAAAGALEDAQHATQRTLAEKTQVMNAYMLWAVSLSGTTLDQDRPEARSDEMMQRA